MADLITLDEYKVYEKINSSSNDEQMQAVLTSVSSLIKSYCNTTFVDNTGSPGLSEVFDIQWDTYVVQLKDSPILSILSVEERSSQANAYTQLVNDGTDGKYEFYVDYFTDSVFRTNITGGYICFPRGTGSVKVTYTSGYITVPEDLKLAVVDLVRYYLKNEYKDRYAIGATSVDNPDGSSIINSSDFPDHIKRVLDLYKVY